MQLFEDQAEFVDKLRQSLRDGHKSILGVASPAFGKTVVAGYITREVHGNGGSCWFLVHRKNLLRQTSQSFWKAKIEHGLLTSGKRQSKLPIQIGTIGTVYSRFAKLKAPKVMFVDEAHLARGNMFETVIRWALDHGSIVIGLTGTPRRLDGKALGDLFTDLVEARSTHWLIQQGRLSEYEIYSTPVVADLSEVNKSGGDYNREQLADAMGKASILGDAVEHYKKLAMGKRAVCYCANVKHSKQTVAAFNNAGVPAVHVDGDTTEAELKEACNGLADGKYMVISCCELIIEGFDLSAQVGRDITLEVCILLRPTQSLARYLQMVFRALRRKPYPALILDHAGCAMQHGLPDDEREWSLDGQDKKKRKKNEDDDLLVKQCPKCYFIFKAGPNCCPKCGEALPVKGKAELQVVSGELQKIDVAAVRRERKKEQGSARGLNELVALGVRRGMNRPAEWAAITYAARLKRKPTPTEFNQAKKALRDIKNESRNDNPAQDNDRPF